MSKTPDPNDPEEMVKDIKANFDTAVSRVNQFFASMFEKLKKEFTALSTSGDSVAGPEQDSKRPSKHQKSSQRPLILSKPAEDEFNPSEFTDILSKKMHGDKKLKLNDQIKPTPNSPKKSK